MQPFKAAMLRVRQAFYEAFIRSLLRTKSILQTILNLWISPTPKLTKQSELGVDDEAAAAAAAGVPENGVTAESSTSVRRGTREVADFVHEVEMLFRAPTKSRALIALSEGLRAQFEESLVENAHCMLPSYQHQLPTGDECGTYLALDVGGSTFRVALIDLAGGETAPRILRRSTTKIDQAVKNLQGVEFFDWMAGRIEETLFGQTEGHEMDSAPLAMGMAWSFPIEQTSLRSGLLLGMGKNFMAAHGLLGQDLGDLIQSACSRKHLNVELHAIVNDSSACLLSSSFSTRLPTPLSLILGTGVNAAVHLPTKLFSPKKFGLRPASWHSIATHVIVNSELSMFGARVLPFTRWDKQLLTKHPRPHYQPLEYFVGGGYLGEIVRLVLVDAIESTGIFGGVVPPSLTEPYSLDTETISHVEADASPTLTVATQRFSTAHPPFSSSLPYTTTDILTLRTLASHIIHRAAAITAAGLHALWLLQLPVSSRTQTAPPSKSLIAYNGSVIEQYPGFCENAQKHLDLLVAATVGGDGLELVPADDSSLLGAAVAVACLRVGEMEKNF